VGSLRPRKALRGWKHPTDLWIFCEAFSPRIDFPQIHSIFPIWRRRDIILSVSSNVQLLQWDYRAIDHPVLPYCYANARLVVPPIGVKHGRWSPGLCGKNVALEVLEPAWISCVDLPNYEWFGANREQSPTGRLIFGRLKLPMLNAAPSRHSFPLQPLSISSIQRHASATYLM